MDRLDAMTAFTRVVECKSFTKAAQTLRMSRPTVTQLVQQLEARLEVRLLHRTTRSVRLTADGATYYARVVRLLGELEATEASVRRASRAPRGRLRVDAPAPFARRIMVPALPSFRARYPDIQIVLGVSDREVDVVVDGVDCVIRGGEPPPSDLRMRRLGELSLGVFASPSYLDRFGVPEHPRELETHHQVIGFLRQRTGAPRPVALRRDAETVVVAGGNDIVVDDGDAYLAAGVAGLGVVAAPSYMCAPHVVRGELTAILASWHLEPMPLVALSPSGRHPSERVRVFIDWVASLMGGTIGWEGARRP
jgi:DNA-binding transcriptional LysR family regulator